VNRRAFLSAGSAAAAGAMIGGYTATMHAPVPAGAEPVTLGVQRRMIIQLARAGTMFPVRLPVRGHASPARAERALSRLRAAQDQLEPGLLQLGAAARPSLARLHTAEQAMPAEELAAAREGAAVLVHAGLLDSGHAALLAGLGRMMTTAEPAERAGLHGAATLAVRMVFGDAAHHRVAIAAGRWLSLLSVMHTQGTLRPAIRQRGMW